MGLFLARSPRCNHLSPSHGHRRVGGHGATSTLLTGLGVGAWGGVLTPTGPPPLGGQRGHRLGIWTECVEPELLTESKAILHSLKFSVA